LEEFAYIAKVTTVAEGIETISHLEILRAMGCKEYQGYYFSKPLDAASFESRYRNCAD